MKCPKCKNGEVEKQISVKGIIFKKKEIYYFCPLCEWENKKVFKLSKDDVEMELYNQTKDKNIEYEKARHTKEEKRSSEYKQEYIRKDKSK